MVANEVKPGALPVRVALVSLAERPVPDDRVNVGGQVALCLEGGLRLDLHAPRRLPVDRHLCRRGLRRAAPDDAAPDACPPPDARMPAHAAALAGDTRGGPSGPQIPAPGSNWRILASRCPHTGDLSGVSRITAMAGLPSCLVITCGSRQATLPPVTRWCMSNAVIAVKVRQHPALWQVLNPVPKLQAQLTSPSGTG